MIEGYVVEIKHNPFDQEWHPLNGFFEIGETYAGGLSARQAAHASKKISVGIWTSARVRKVVLLYI